MNIILPLSMIIAFAVSIILAPIFIPVLRRMKMGQTEREEGVKSHLKKAGTPTMGGLIFLIAASQGGAQTFGRAASVAEAHPSVYSNDDISCIYP